MKRRPLPWAGVVFAPSFTALTGDCSPDTSEGQDGLGGPRGGDAEAIEAEIAQRVSEYLEVLTVTRDADVAGDYYTEDARLPGPGTDSDRPSLIEEMRRTFDSGVQVQVDRRTI